MPVASLLLVLATVLQQPESDDIGLPDSLPADRTWELAAAYFQRVGESIWKKDADSAVKWEARARHRLPEPYLSALYQVAADFSGRFREAVDKRIGNDFRLESGVDLGFWDAKEILDSPPPLYNPSPDHYRKAGLFQRAAWVEGARGEYERALEAVKHLETVGNNDAWKRFAADLRIRIAELKECDDDPAVLAKLSTNHPHQRLHSMTMTFGALKRLSVRPGPPGSPRRAQSFKAMASLLKGIEDRAGAQAMEDRVFKEVGASADDLAGILYARVHVNVSSGYPEPSPER